MPQIRSQSAEEDRCSVHFGDQVAIYDVSRADAEAIAEAHVRLFSPTDAEKPERRRGQHARRGLQAPARQVGRAA